MKRALLAALLVLTVASRARATLPWTSDEDAGSRFRLRNLLTPASPGEPATLHTVTPGACGLASTGVDGDVVCAANPVASITVTDPISNTGTSTAPIFGLKFTNVDLTLTVAGALQVGAFTGAIVKAAGATATTFGVAGPLSVLANATNGSVAPAFLGGGSAGQSLMVNGAGTALVWQLTPASSVSGLAAIATTGSANDLVAGTIPTARLPTFTTDVVNAGLAMTIQPNVVTVAKIQQFAGDSLVGVAGGSLANAAAIIASADNQVYQRLGGTVQAHTLDYSQLTGTPASLPPSGLATNDLGGSYPGPTVLAAEFGAQRLTFSTTADGALLKRSGTTVAPAVLGTDYVATVRADGIATGTLQLASISAANMLDGAIAWVDSVGDYFRLSQSALTTTPTTVVAASGKSGYQWLRVGAHNFTWEAQTAWWVDPANSTGLASDENSGLSSSLPLLTLAEHSRRLRGASFSSPVVLNQMSDQASSGDVPVYSYQFGPSGGFTILGAKTAIYSGTVSSATNATNAGGATDDNSITDSGIPVSYTASGLMATGIIFTRTNGTVASFYAAKDKGSKTLRTSWLANSSNPVSVPTFSPGDSYTAYRLPKIFSLGMPPSDIPGVSDGQYLKNIDVRIPNFGGITKWGGGFIEDFFSANSIFGTSYFQNCGWDTGTQFAILNNGAVLGGLFRGSGSTSYTVQTAVINFEGAPFMLQGGHLSVEKSNVTSFLMSCYDSTGGICLDVFTNARWLFTTGGISGSGNTSAMLGVSIQGTIGYNTAPVASASSTSAAFPLSINGVGVAVGSYPIDSTGEGIFNYATPSSFLADPGSNGMLSRTAPGVLTPRAIQQADATITVTNGDGVSGNPSIGVNAIPESKVTNLTTDLSAINTTLSGKQPTGNYLVGLSSAVTATGPGTPTATVHLDAGATVLGLLPLGNLANCAPGQYVGMVGGVEGCVTPASTSITLTGPVTGTGSGSVSTSINLGGGSISGTLALANQAAPTGTGFEHITSGARDAAARAVNLATADVTGLLPVGSIAPSGTNGWVITTVGGVAVWQAQAAPGVGTVTNVSMTVGDGTVATPTSTPVISLAAVGPGAGTYGGTGISSVQIDGRGRVVNLGLATYLTSTGTTPGTYNNVTDAASGLIIGASNTSWVSTVGAVMTSGGLAALPTGDAAFTYSTSTHTATMTGATPFSFTASGSQFIDKTNGALAMGTSDGNSVVLYTGGTNRMSIDPSGNAFIGTLAAGGIVKALPSTGGELVIASSTDLATALGMPAATDVLVSTGPTTAPTGGAGLTFLSGILSVGNSVKFGGLAGNSVLFTDGSGFAAVDSSGTPLTYNLSTHTLGTWHLAVGSSATMGDLTTFGSVQFSGYAGTGGYLTVDATGFMGVSPLATTISPARMFFHWTDGFGTSSGATYFLPEGGYWNNSTLPTGSNLEYPVGFIATHISWSINVTRNGISSGALVIQPTRNGSPIGGTSFSLTSGSGTGVVNVASAVATGSASSTDVYGMTIGGTYTDGSFGGCLMTISAVLAP